MVKPTILCQEVESQAALQNDTEASTVLVTSVVRQQFSKPNYLVIHKSEIAGNKCTL